MAGAHEASTFGTRRAGKESIPTATTTGGVCKSPTGGLDALAEALGISAREMAAVMQGFLANRMAEAQELAAGDFRRWLADRQVEPRPGLVGSGRPGGDSASYSFRDAGDFWEVVFEGRPWFSIPKTLGAKYLHYLLFHPNRVIRAQDLEAEVCLEKDSARREGSVQELLDSQAEDDVNAELKDLEVELEQAKEAENAPAVQRIEGEIAALKATAGKSFGMAADGGERARNNVRKAVTRVIRYLRRRNPDQRHFATHLALSIKLGHEIMYLQPKGDIWK